MVIEACPRLRLAEQATEAQAQAMLDGTGPSGQLVSNCVGYCPPGVVSPGVFTATDGGDNLEIEANFPGGSDGIFEGSVNVLKGESIIVNYTFSIANSSGSPTDMVFVVVRNQDGALVDSDFAVYTTGSGTGSFVFPNLPYTGRYNLSLNNLRLFSSSSGVPTLDTDFIISSSGELTVNPVQAVYDTGGCPGLLECAP